MSQQTDFQLGLMFWFDTYYMLRGRRHMHRFTFALGPTDWDYDILFRELIVQLCGRLMRHRSVQCTMIFAIYTELWPWPGLVVPLPMIIPGDVFEEAAPNDVAAVMSMKTGLTGRKNRGRKFLVGLPVSAWDGDYLTMEARRDISITWRALEDIFGPDNESEPLQWGVLHRYVNGHKLLPIITNFWPYNDLTLRAHRMRHEHTASYHNLFHIPPWF